MVLDLQRKQVLRWIYPSPETFSRWKTWSLTHRRNRFSDGSTMQFLENKATEWNTIKYCIYAKTSEMDPFRSHWQQRFLSNPLHLLPHEEEAEASRQNWNSVSWRVWEKGWGTLEGGEATSITHTLVFILFQQLSHFKELQLLDTRVLLNSGSVCVCSNMHLCFLIFYIALSEYRAAPKDRHFSITTVVGSLLFIYVSSLFEKTSFSTSFHS